MEFRRIEVKRVVRHREKIIDGEEIRDVFLAIQKNKLRFAIVIEGTGATWRNCVVLSVEEENVTIFAREPQKVKRKVSFVEVFSIEVESNCDFVSDDDDDEGRWALLM
jgi:hypothetical protein